MELPEVEVMEVVAGAAEFATGEYATLLIRGAATPPAERERVLARLADMVDQQAARIEELFLEGVQTLAHALEAKDAYTKGHSARVAAYAGRIAAVLGLSDADVQLIELGAELHDIQ